MFTKTEKQDVQLDFKDDVSLLADTLDSLLKTTDKTTQEELSDLQAKARRALRDTRAKLNGRQQPHRSIRPRWRSVRPRRGGANQKLCRGKTLAQLGHHHCSMDRAGRSVNAPLVRQHRGCARAGPRAHPRQTIHPHQNSAAVSPAKSRQNPP
ncbi:hypothetical protein SODG_001305 [Sodalis praecaptivus]